MDGVGVEWAEERVGVGKEVEDAEGRHSKQWARYMLRICCKVRMNLPWLE
jgi:hypothetical protein